jgi:hypothetical protein
LDAASVGAAVLAASPFAAAMSLPAGVACGVAAFAADRVRVLAARDARLRGGALVSAASGAAGSAAVPLWSGAVPVGSGAAPDGVPVSGAVLSVMTPP